MDSDLSIRDIHLFPRNEIAILGFDLLVVVDEEIDKVVPVKEREPLIRLLILLLRVVGVAAVETNSPFSSALSVWIKSRREPLLVGDNRCLY